MKNILVKIGKSKKLALLAQEHAVSIGYNPEEDENWVDEILTLDGYWLVCYSDKYSRLHNHKCGGVITHTIEAFFNLTPEDTQDYNPRTHKVTAKRIKELLGADERDVIELED